MRLIELKSEAFKHKFALFKQLSKYRTKKDIDLSEAFENTSDEKVREN